MKKNYKIVLAFILGILVSGTSVYAATKYLASDVTYKGTTVEKALNEFYSKVRASRWHDRNFSKEDDVDLTEAEVKAIDEYWGRFKFAYPEIFYESFKIFKNRCGYFDKTIQFCFVFFLLFDICYIFNGLCLIYGSSRNFFL